MAWVVGQREGWNGRLVSTDSREIFRQGLTLACAAEDGDGKMAQPHELALRYARRLARADGILLGRFSLVEGSKDSLMGREWWAPPHYRYPSVRSVAVWEPIGEKNINGALQTCAACRSFGGRLFGITIRGNR